MAKTRELKPDLVILDLTMPRAGGLSAAHAIRQSRMPTKILIITRHACAELERTVGAAGCDGRVQKANASDDLIRGVRAVLAGHQFFGSEVVRAQTA